MRGEYLWELHCKPIPCNENRVFPVKFSHREIPVMIAGVPAMRTGVPCNENRFSLCGKLHRENPVLALHWPCAGLQCVTKASAHFLSFKSGCEL